MLRPAIYCASRASVIDRPMMWNTLRDMGGHNIISTWHNTENIQQNTDMLAMWTQIEREIAVCDALILYAEPKDLPLKGAYVEAGMALAMGKQVFVVYAPSGNPTLLRQHLGSWVSHPNVVVCEALETAFYCIERNMHHDSVQAARG